MDGGDPFVLDRNQCARNWQIAFTGPATGSTAPSRDFLPRRQGRDLFGNNGSRRTSGSWCLFRAQEQRYRDSPGRPNRIWLDGATSSLGERGALRDPSNRRPAPIRASFTPPIPTIPTSSSWHSTPTSSTGSSTTKLPELELWRLARNGGVEELLSSSFTASELSQSVLSGFQVLGDYVLISGLAQNLNNPFAWSVSTTTNQRITLPVLLPNPAIPPPRRRTPRCSVPRMMALSSGRVLTRR